MMSAMYRTTPCCRPSDRVTGEKPNGPQRTPRAQRKQNVLDLGSAAAQHMNPAAFDRCVMKRKNRCVLHSSRCVTSLASTRTQVNLCFLCVLGALCGWLCGFRLHAVPLESPGFFICLGEPRF